MKLVIGFDIGTTFSGVSYSFQKPGQTADIRGVTRFPGQENVGGNAKVPSILYYDDDGVLQAVGAEAVREGIEEKAQKMRWTKVEWFKLHLRPSVLALPEEIPKIPSGKHITDIFADFLQYLYRCVRTYISDTYLTGTQLLDDTEPNIQFIITHPNGWEGFQQSYLRAAAVRAGLVQNVGDQRIHLVTEGEAALHFCLRNPTTAELMKTDGGIIVADAGGGTVDLSAYSRSRGGRKISFAEIAIQRSIFQGSIFVTKNARKYIEKQLIDSSWAEEIDNIASSFNNTTKLNFCSKEEPHYIKFGKSRDTDENLNIINGRLRVSGSDVASFFEPCIQGIVAALKEQSEEATEGIHTIFLVGGFAANDWLFGRLKEAFEQDGIEVCRPDGHLNKAVADGAVAFYLDHHVTSRMAKYTIGTPCAVLYDSRDPEHRRRLASVITNADGEEYVPEHFSPIVEKGDVIKEDAIFRDTCFHKEKARGRFPSQITDEIISYRGNLRPVWLDREKNKFVTLGKVSFEVTTLMKKALREKVGKNGKRYFQLQYDIVLEFGWTELKGHMRWKDNKGKERRGPVSIIYESDQGPMTQAMSMY